MKSTSMMQARTEYGMLRILPFLDTCGHSKLCGGTKGLHLLLFSLGGISLYFSYSSLAITYFSFLLKPFSIVSIFWIAFSIVLWFVMRLSFPKKLMTFSFFYSRISNPPLFYLVRATTKTKTVLKPAWTEVLYRRCKCLTFNWHHGRKNYFFTISQPSLISFGENQKLVQHLHLLS